MIAHDVYLALPLNRQSTMNFFRLQAGPDQWQMLFYDHPLAWLGEIKGPPTCPGQVPTALPVFSEQWRNAPSCLFQHRIDA